MSSSLLLVVLLVIGLFGTYSMVSTGKTATRSEGITMAAALTMSVAAMIVFRRFHNIALIIVALGAMAAYFWQFFRCLSRRAH